MRSSRCGHRLSVNKKRERVDALVQFMRTATRHQLTTKLKDVWGLPQATITEARLLLTLGADPSTLLEEDYGEKILQDRVSQGTVCEDCKPKFESFLQHSFSIHEEMFEQTPIRLERKTHERLLPLCMDGGGMRGLVSVVCLLFSSRRLLADESLPQLFDWYIGTSTGSMLALQMAKGASLSDCFFLYWGMKRRIFLEGSTMARLLGDQVSVQTKNIEEVLLECFPSESFLQCTKMLSVPALDISNAPAKLHVFRNYSFTRPLGCKMNEEDDVLFREAARASSAAPTYFEPFEYKEKKFVDGSFVANYPLNVLFKEFDLFAKHDNRLSLAAVLSIGTGEPAESQRKYKTGSTLKAKAKNMAHLSTLILEQIVGQDLTAVDMAQDRCHGQNIPFIRLSPKGVNVRIDQIDDGKLTDMLWTTLVWLTENVREVDKLGELLHTLHLDPNNDRKKRSNTVL